MSSDAGKTTTINMLTGFLEPSGGDALVEGRSVRTRMPEIYRMMGVCPQVRHRPACARAYMAYSPT